MTEHKNGNLHPDAWATKIWVKPLFLLIGVLLLTFIEYEFSELKLWKSAAIASAITVLFFYFCIWLVRRFKRKKTDSPEKSYFSKHAFEIYTLIFTALCFGLGFYYSQWVYKFSDFGTVVVLVAAIIVGALGGMFLQLLFPYIMDESNAPLKWFKPSGMLAWIVPLGTLHASSCGITTYYSMKVLPNDIGTIHFVMALILHVCIISSVLFIPIGLIIERIYSTKIQNAVLEEDGKSTEPSMKAVSKFSFWKVVGYAALCFWLYVSWGFPWLWIATPVVIAAILMYQHQDKIRYVAGSFVAIFLIAGFGIAYISPQSTQFSIKDMKTWRLMKWHHYELDILSQWFGPNENKEKKISPTDWKPLSWIDPSGSKKKARALAKKGSQVRQADLGKLATKTGIPFKRVVAPNVRPVPQERVPGRKAAPTPRVAPRPSPRRTKPRERKVEPRVQPRPAAPRRRIPARKRKAAPPKRAKPRFKTVWKTKTRIVQRIGKLGTKYAASKGSWTRSQARRFMRTYRTRFRRAFKSYVKTKKFNKRYPPFILFRFTNGQYYMAYYPNKKMRFMKVKAGYRNNQLAPAYRLKITKRHKKRVRVR